MVPKGAVRDSFCFLLDTGDDLALHFVRLFIPYVGCLYCQENGSPPVLSALNIFFINGQIMEDALLLSIPKSLHGL